MTKRRITWRRSLGIAFAGWIVLALLTTPGFYFDVRLLNARTSLDSAFGQAFLASLAWAAVTYLVLMFSQWLRNRRLSAKYWVIVQLVFGVAVVFILLLLTRWWQWPVLGLVDIVQESGFSAAMLAGLPRGFAIYAGVWGLCQAGVLWREHVWIQRRLVSTELRRLRTQLNPHFLFNTLNAISELGYENPEAADRTITQLSGLLRKSLDDSHQQEIALRDELDFLRRYLAIQQTLLRERLHVELEISDSTLNARVPSMILQPLVENAVTHGIGRTGIGYITVRVLRRDDLLVLEVQDNGWGLFTSEPRKSREGIGINNIRARLRYLYGDLASLDLQSQPGEGLTAHLNIPFHEAYAYSEDPYPDR